MNTEQGQQQASTAATPAVSHLAVLVLGMHRSGTSALTRVLSLLGADLPSVLQPPDIGNDLGFWEPAELVVIHDQLLASAGSSWDDYRKLPPEWSSGEAAPEYRQRILEVLKKDFSGSNLFVLKDPRVCRFVPLWQKVLREFHAEPLYAMCYRNPLEVAGSLRARNEFGTAFSCLLWLRHVLDAERFSRGGKRTWISYEHVMNDWRPELTRATSDLGLKLTRLDDPQANREIEAYIRPEQRHHHRTLADLQANPEVPAWVSQVYEAIEQERAQPGSARQIFDDVAARMDEMDSLLVKLGGGKRAYVTEVAALKHSVEMHRRELDAIRKQGDLLQQHNQALKDEAQVAAQASQRHIGELERGIAQLQGEITRLQREVAQKPALEESLKATEERAARLASEIEILQARQASLQAELTSLRETEAEAKRLQAELAKITAARAVDAQERQQQLDTIRQRESDMRFFQTVAGINERRLERVRRDLTKARVRLGEFARQPVNGAKGGGRLVKLLKKNSSQEIREFVARSGLFDEAFYLAKNPDVAKSGRNALDHYLEFGWQEQRQPHPLFDVAYYLSRNPDIAQAKINPLVHYLLHGAWEGRDPNQLFSSQWYLTTYLDVAVTGINPLSHYILQGAGEGRWPNARFNPTGYQMSHPGEAETGTSFLENELQVMKSAGHPLPEVAHRRPVEGRDRQFFDVFDFTLRNPPVALVPPSTPLDLNHLKISIVVPTFEAGAGGIMTILRLVQQLEFAGHEVTILVQSLIEERRTAADFQDLIQRHFLPVRAKVRKLDEVPESEIQGDALIATDRWTCFPVRSLKNFRRRFYLVQDYETLFYPMGSEALLTEGTYYFGFDAICAGPWLAELASKKFGMRSWSFELAADPTCYYQIPNARRGKNRIAFYARIATARRAVELGYLAFEVLRQKNVDFHVDFFGADFGHPNLGYSYTNHGIMSAKQLGELYNVASVGLVFSATNYSLIPREMMACGLPVIELDSDSSRMSFPDVTAELVRPDPIAMAGVLQALLADPVRRDTQARRGLAFAAQFSWEASGKAVEAALKEGLTS